MVEALMRVERSLAEVEKNLGEKRLSFVFNGGGMKNAKDRAEPTIKNQRCIECDKRHLGVCKQNSIVCFKYGQTRHF